jgi:glycosyltransferase involved in cell wall biosynthesis
VGRAVGEFEVCSTRHIVEDSLNPVVSIGDELTRHRESASVAVSCGVQRSYTDRTNRYRETGLEDGWCTIHNGIDVAEYADRVDAAEPALQNAGTPAFLNVGRYVPQKRQRDLIDAVAILTEAVPDATLHIVGGSGPLKSDLRTRARERSVADAVTVTGFVPDVAAYYTAADAFVSSSVSEGLPVTILEAMSSGLPVVGTDIPGVDEVVEQEESGYLVSPEDPSALAGAMERLADDETRRRLGENGHERARKRFDVRQMVDAYHDLYLDLAGDRR